MKAEVFQSSHCNDCQGSSGRSGCLLESGWIPSSWDTCISKQEGPVVGTRDFCSASFGLCPPGEGTGVLIENAWVELCVREYEVLSHFVNECYEQHWVSEGVVGAGWASVWSPVQLHGTDQTPSLRSQASWFFRTSASPAPFHVATPVTYSVGTFSIQPHHQARGTLEYSFNIVKCQVCEEPEVDYPEAFQVQTIGLFSWLQHQGGFLGDEMKSFSKTILLELSDTLSSTFNS